jgi:hypothetical protein
VKKRNKEFVLRLHLKGGDEKFFDISAFGRIFSAPCLSSTFVISS